MKVLQKGKAKKRILSALACYTFLCTPSKELDVQINLGNTLEIVRFQELSHTILQFTLNVELRNVQNMPHTKMNWFYKMEEKTKIS